MAARHKVDGEAALSDARRLCDYLRWLRLVAIAFSVASAGAYAIGRDSRIAVACLIIASVALIATWSLHVARSTMLARAAMIAAYGILGVCVAFGAVLPQVFPTVAIVPLFVVASALPYVAGRPMRVLIVLSWCVTASVTVAGNVLAPPPTTPAWFPTFLVVAGVSAVSFLVVYLQAQFAARQGEHRVAIERHNATLGFLADSSAVFAESLDLDETLARASRTFVPFLADWCCIDVIEAGGSVRRAASVHADPAKETALRELERRYPLRQGTQQPAAVAIARGAPLVVETLDAEALAKHAVDEDNARIVTRLETRSVLAAPILVRGEVAGALTLGSEQSGRYTQRDVPVVEDVARRLGLAIASANQFEQEKRAVQLRDDFLAIAGHELKTPLTALKLYVHALLRRAESDHLDGVDGTERLRKSAKQVARLEELIAQLLDVTRITAGHLHLERSTTDLADLLADAMERFADTATRAGCEVRVETSGSLEGDWDRARLDQVLTNLFSNALKYGAGKPIVVTVQGYAAHVEIEVADQGIGIEADARDRIFDRFERAVSDRHYGGFGLGLWIVRSIVRAHGGEVRVESEPHVRTRFIVDLPRAIEEVVGSTSPPLHQQGQGR